MARGPPKTFGLILGVFFLSFLAEEAVFRGIFQWWFSAAGPAPGVILSTAAQALLGAAGFLLAFRPLFPSNTYSVRVGEKHLPVLPVLFLACAGVLSGHGFLAAILYLHTDTIAAPAVFFALTFSFLFSGSIGVRTFPVD